MDRQSILTNSVIVAAHPDDELLWFTSILREVDQVIMVFEDFAPHPHLGEARRRVIVDYPRAGVTSLAIEESGALGCADWSAPEPGAFGLKLGYEEKRRAITNFARSSYSVLRLDGGGRRALPRIERAYATNYGRIYAALKERLKPDMNVFTHNPWGEYGHEEHVQLFRVVDRLRSEIGFKLWMSNYCTNRSLPLATRYFPASSAPYLRLPADKDFANQVADVYKKHGCWTWSDDWTWFEDECFMEAPDGARAPVSGGHLFPLNIFTIDVPRQSRMLAATATVAASAATVALAMTAMAD